MKLSVAWATLGVCVVLGAAIPSPARAGDNAGEAQGGDVQGQEQATVAARKTPAARPAKSATPAVSDPEGLERELAAAREQRDRDLKEASKETDRRRFEKRKEEIFARYAAIVAEMRDKYQAAQAQADAGEPTPPPQGMGKTSKSATPRPGTSRADSSRPGIADRNGERPSGAKPVSRNVRRDDENATEPDAPRSSSRKAAKPERPARDDRAAELADAQKKLDDENARHADRMDELSRQLKDAQLSDNAREVRKAERAIEKESTTYEAKKVILERRVRELGGGSDAGAPPAPSGSGKSAGRTRR